MASPKIELNLSEDNELGFKLKIEGSAQDIGNSKPKIRFALTENNTGRGWIFNTEKSENDGISVTIPAMKGLVIESENYSGKLEVILGEHYFTPTVVDVKFIEPLKVEAAMVVKRSNKKNTIEEQIEKIEDEQTLIVESQIESIIKKPSKKEESKSEPIEQKIVKEEQELELPLIKKEVKKLSYSDLSEDQKKEVNKLFVEKCKKLDPENFKSVKDVDYYMKEGTDYTRNRLKALIAQSTKQYLDNF
jgi:hypothetical protein